MSRNHYGMQQRRITAYRVPRSQYQRREQGHKHLSEIASIWLENSRLLEIELKNGNTIRYLSMMAPTIVQQITTRVKSKNCARENCFFTPFSQGQTQLLGPGSLMRQHKNSSRISTRITRREPRTWFTTSLLI